MTTNVKLNDLQLILLSTASRRHDGSVLPPADSIAKEEKRIRAVIQQLLKRGLIEEVPTKDRRLGWREEAEQPIGLAITNAGRAIIAPETDAGQTASKAKVKKKKDVPASPRASKTSIVLDLLRRPEGATLNELVDATGWLPHTTRAALTGLRKKGHVIEKGKREDATCYRITAVA
jgi:predicted transcriptional regulator